MRLKPEQLSAALQKGLAPVYLLSGDEPLQLGECADAIRKAARQNSYDAREMLASDSTGFGWHQLAETANSLSLFTDKKIVDLRVSTVGTDGAKALTTYCEHLPQDTLLLISMGQLKKDALKSRWFEAIDKVGVVIQVWSPVGQDLVQWLGQRLQQRGLKVDNEGVKVIAGRVEGNLLAAAQEVEKLYVLYGTGTLTTQQVLDAVADSSRYDVFTLIDSILAASVKRIFKILNSLQAEGIAAPVILWALTRETRSLLKIKLALARGENSELVFRNHQIWDKRKQLVGNALRRLTESQLENILVLSAKADRQIKGQQAGDAWETLLVVCLLLASVETLRG